MLSPRPAGGGGVALGARADLAFASDRQIQSFNDNGATAAILSETDFAVDSRAIREKVLSQATGEGGPAAAADGLYRGMAGLIDYRAGFRREHK